MKRSAILIEASEVRGETKLPGAKKDVDAFKDWLTTNHGGQWYASEIQILRTPKVAEVRNALNGVGKVDYAFVTFSGHGYHAKELDFTKVCLLDGQMTARELCPETDRGTVVIDACRKVMAEVLMESIQLSANILKHARAAAVRDYRAEFDKLVMAAEKGLEFIYSCDLDESAGESRQGGYYSMSLLEIADGFALNNRDGENWLSVEMAFTRSSTMTTSRNAQQHPQFEPGRRRVHFPFGV